MRIFYLPISGTRQLIYCQKLDTPLVHAKPQLDDRLAVRLSHAFDRFAQSPTKWKRTVTYWVDKLLDTVPFEEAGLKTVPPRHNRMRQLADGTHISEREAIRTGKVRELMPVPLIYPSRLDFGAVQETIRADALTALKTHRKQMVWCVAGLPLTLPLALNPVLPNIPAFYLIYRLWSNYRAYRAAQNLEYLVRHKQFRPEILPALDAAYNSHSLPMSPELADKLSDIFDDQALDRIVKQGIRSTRNHRTALRGA